MSIQIIKNKKSYDRLYRKLYVKYDHINDLLNIIKIYLYSENDEVLVKTGNIKNYKLYEERDIVYLDDIYIDNNFITHEKNIRSYRKVIQIDLFDIDGNDFYVQCKAVINESGTKIRYIGKNNNDKICLSLEILDNKFINMMDIIKKNIYTNNVLKQFSLDPKYLKHCYLLGSKYVNVYIENIKYTNANFSNKQYDCNLHIQSLLLSSHDYPIIQIKLKEFKPISKLTNIISVIKDRLGSFKTMFSI